MLLNGEMTLEKFGFLLYRNIEMWSALSHQIPVSFAIFRFGLIILLKYPLGWFDNEPFMIDDRQIEILFFDLIADR